MMAKNLWIILLTAIVGCLVIATLVQGEDTNNKVNLLHLLAKRGAPPFFDFPTCVCVTEPCPCYPSRPRFPPIPY